MRLKTLLIDDDQLALDIMKHELKKYPEIKIEGAYTNPLAALKRIDGIKPDVVFLDIDMPQLTGLDAASQISNRHLDTDIVFVTSHKTYAVEAFEINALDYLVKPVSKKRLEKTIQKLLYKKQALINRQSQILKSADNLEIKSLGRFQINWQGEQPIRWRSGLTRELAAFLVQNRGKKVSRDRILEELWPDDNLKTTVTRLYSGIHYIRKALEAYDIKRDMIELSGKYSIMLNPSIKPDTALFEDAVSNLDDNADIAAFEAIDVLYTGDYLEEESWLWAYPERERLNNLYIRFTNSLVSKYMDFLLYEKAEAVLLKLFNKNPYEENITLSLLQIYKITNKKTKAFKHFRAYEALLINELGLNPKENIRRLYASIK